MSDELPLPDKVAERLAALSRRHDESLTDREHAWLNAADHYLRRVVDNPQEDSDDELAYGGVCPVCGEDFVDGFDVLDAGESRDARICIVEKGDSRGECLLHLPEEDSDE